MSVNFSFLELRENLSRKSSALHEYCQLTFSVVEIDSTKHMFLSENDTFKHCTKEGT